MKSRTITAVAFVLAFGAACSSEPAGSQAEGDWVGTITTEGNVTTVVNQAGSLWGGTATLVEEASIGVDVGPNEYMLGAVTGVSATDDFIYVLDAQVPALRVYEHDGTFVRNLGGEGQGPGEYTSPSLLAADDSGRVFILDSSLRRINAYAPSGEPLDPWRMPDPRCCAWPMYPLTDEAVWAPVQEWLDDHSDRRYGVQAIGPSGPYGEITWIPEIDYEQATYQVEGDFEDVAPFSPWLTWNPAPHGRLLAGTSDRYRFEVHDPDGFERVVQRYWDPVPVPTEHREWERQRTVAFRRRYTGPEFTWDGAEIPDNKAAYVGLIPTQTSETWVIRQGASERITDCAEDPIAEGHVAAYERPCWSEEVIIDAFGADGRYLGEVEAPEGVGLRSLGVPMTLSVDGDRAVTVVQDEASTIMVKRYRLVRPGGERRAR